MNSSLMDDAANRHLLAVAEDRLNGFHEQPFAELAIRCGMPEREVLHRLHDMLQGDLSAVSAKPCPATPSPPVV